MTRIGLEDLEPGTVSTFGHVTVDRDEMVAFARDFDPQPFHLDEDAARATAVGRLIASGWYTGALQMRMLCDGWLNRSAVWAGLGVEELSWLEPVVPGDVLSVRQTILDRRPSGRRPELGIVRSRAEVVAGGERVVARLVNVVLVGHRDAAPPALRPEVPREGGSAQDLPDDGRQEDPAGAARWFDEIEIGRAVDLGRYAFTPDRIVGFARRFDPQPFHLDIDAAARGQFGGLTAPGWHVAAAWMSRYAARLSRIAATGEPARIGVSPGFRDLRWRRPVFAGDVIRFTAEPIGKRPLASRPGWGTVTNRNAALNERGETVMEFLGSAFWRRRP